MGIGHFLCFTFSKSKNLLTPLNTQCSNTASLYFLKPWKIKASRKHILRHIIETFVCICKCTIVCYTACLIVMMSQYFPPSVTGFKRPKQARTNACSQFLHALLLKQKMTKPKYELRNLILYLTFRVCVSENYPKWMSTLWNLWHSLAQSYIYHQEPVLVLLPSSDWVGWHYIPSLSSVLHK